MKMIDTWLIFTLFIPFMEVILQTRMAVVNRRLKSMDLVLDMNSLKNSENKENTWIQNQDKLDLLKKRDTQTLRYDFIGCLQTIKIWIRLVIQKLTIFCFHSTILQCLGVSLFEYI